MGRRRWPSPATGSRSRPRLTATLLALFTLVITEAPMAHALVPYVFVPPQKELEGAGLGIAQAATRLLRIGQAEEAARLAELTVRLLPQDPRGWVLLAEAQLRSNKIDKALYSLSRAKQLDPANPGIWFAEGALALRNGKPKEATALLARGLMLDRENPGAYFDLGNAQLLLNDPSLALQSFERAASLRKDFWEAINNQGLVLFELGRSQQAIDRWRKVLTMKPSSSEPTLALAAGLFNRSPQDRAEALKLAEAALNEDPNYVKDAYQKEQLWGVKLRAATARLLAQPELKATVERALANAGDSARSEE